MKDRDAHWCYNTTNYPTFVCNHGNWDIHRNESGYCAAIPTDKAAADGCIATHFGDMAYVEMMVRKYPSQYRLVA